MDEKQLIDNYHIDINLLRREQIKLSKALNIKDLQDFSEIKLFGAFFNITIRNNIISAIIVCNKNFEIVEQQYFLDKLNFPYIYGFRAYREMPAMISAFNKLNEKPEVIFISGHGFDHSRLGLASHISIALNVPTIGVADSLFEGDVVEGDNITLNEKIVGKILKTKETSNPLYISPGDKISIETAYALCKECIKSPHKLPEPLHLASKYAREIKDEVSV